ncbi:MAG: DUF58 domain-containing protein [Blastocatellia bacterium]|nr:DUF58 domain-containing protein [Blastocatellia bacterium]
MVVEQGRKKAVSLPAELAKKIKLFEIHSKKLIHTGFAGEYRSVFRGRGMEFDEVRPYTPGDDVRLIDWNVSARTGELYIKKHIEEREQTVILVVDLSRSGYFTSVDRTKREIAAEICCILGFAAATNNDRVGLLLFTDQVECYVAPERGTRHALRIVRDLMLTEPVSRRTDIASALNYLNRVLPRPAILFLVSDFLSPNFENPLKIASRRHDIVAINLSDKREKDIPVAGMIEIEDTETGETVMVDSSSQDFRQIFQSTLQTQQAELAKLFGKLSIDYVSLYTDEPYEAGLRRLFAMRSSHF